jgi:hypothetical protein
MEVCPRQRAERNEKTGVCMRIPQEVRFGVWKGPKDLLVSHRASWGILPQTLVFSLRSARCRVSRYAASRRFSPPLSPGKENSKRAPGLASLLGLRMNLLSLWAHSLGPAFVKVNLTCES